MNIYNVVYHNNDITDPADPEDPLELLDYVYNLFSDRFNTNNLVNAPAGRRINDYSLTNHPLEEDEAEFFPIRYIAGLAGYLYTIARTAIL